MMYKIGEFSIMAKTTIKTLRYYEKEGLLFPTFVDINGYRYYEASQLVDLAKIISLRQIGLSIQEIKSYLSGSDFKSLLESRKDTICNAIDDYRFQLSKINYLLEGKNMEYEVIVKELPDYTVYYKDGIVHDFSDIVSFILESGEECQKLNPGIQCVEPDYCYLNYLDGEYKENDFKIRYAQAVLKEGISNHEIKFMKLNPVSAVCIYHKGSYDTLRDAYQFIMKYIEDNNYEMVESPREHYIDGMWNKENVNDWLTEIQVPVRKK